MTEPIKLPPYLLAGTLVREGVNKHRARDIEQWMNEEVALAVEKATAELRAEVERLRAVLKKLARLGNEPYYGNSEGNMIARNALKEPK
jgi:hypothetical protein